MIYKELLPQDKNYKESLIKEKINWSKTDSYLSEDTPYFKIVFDSYEDSILNLTMQDPIFTITYGLSTGSILYNDTISGSYFKDIYNQYMSLLYNPIFTASNGMTPEFKELLFIKFSRQYMKDTLEIINNATVVKYNVFDLKKVGEKNYEGKYNNADLGAESKISLLLTTYNPNTYSGFVFHDFGLVAINPRFIMTMDIQLLKSGSLSEICNEFINNVNYIEFWNVSKIYNMLFTCTAETNEFNYSSDPSFVDSEGKIRTFEGNDLAKKGSIGTYITSIGLYDVNDRLLAVAKVSPKKKDKATFYQFKIKVPL